MEKVVIQNGYANVLVSCSC